MTMRTSLPSCYIHQNPEAAGLASCASYRWSSFGEYANLRSRSGIGGLCDTDLALRMLGGREEFVRFHGDPNDGECMDVDGLRSATRSIPDDVAFDIAARAIAPVDVGLMKSMEKGARDDALRKMKSAGLSIRQIERLTGIGRGVISRV